MLKRVHQDGIKASWIWVVYFLFLPLNIGGLAGKRGKFWPIEAGKVELCSA
jgi:hypothetical protein